MFHYRYIIINVILLVFLTSCGFHLRGNIALSPPLKRIYLKAANPYGQLANNLRQYLKMSGVYLANSPNQASTVLEILSENTGQQLLGVTGTQQTRQYNLTLTVTFQVTDAKGRVLVPPEAVMEARTLPINTSQILAGSNEAATMYDQMRTAIIFDIMNRLSSQYVTNLLTHNE